MNLLLDVSGAVRYWLRQFKPGIRDYRFNRKLQALRERPCSRLATLVWVIRSRA